RIRVLVRSPRLVDDSPPRGGRWAMNDRFSSDRRAWIVRHGIRDASSDAGDPSVPPGEPRRAPKVTNKTKLTQMSPMIDGYSVLSSALGAAGAIMSGSSSDTPSQSMLEHIADVLIVVGDIGKGDYSARLTTSHPDDHAISTL